MKKSICFICNTPQGFEAFLKGHAIELLYNYKVTVISNFNNYNLKNIPKSIYIISLPFKRKISLSYDLFSLLKLYYVISKNNFDVTLSISPKSGLLTSIASFIAFTPRRIHWFTGQVWVHKTGFYKKLLMFLDWLIAKLSTNLLVDSYSQKEFLYKKNIINRAKSYVLADGSVCGVDLNRFKPNERVRSEVRRILSINDNYKLIAFVGRLNKDKGIYDLINAFKIIKSKGYSVKLLLIGPDEENIIKRNSFIGKFQKNEIIYLGVKNNPEYWLNGCDIFCLPSYREGFGSVLIEASALKLPVVASKIYGIEDAVLDNVTGLLFKVGNLDDLVKTIIRLLEDNQLCKNLGCAGFERVKTKFSREILKKSFLNYINFKI